MTVAQAAIMQRVVLHGGTSQVEYGNKTMIEWEEGKKLVAQGLLRLVGGNSLPYFWQMTEAGETAWSKLNDELVEVLAEKPKEKQEHCPQCPFARTTSKEYLDTRGDNSERFAGQAAGRFSLPCHMTKQFGRFREDPANQSPCVGAAIYRTNCGYAHLHGRLPTMKRDTDKVFASPEELIAHHKGISLEEAQKHLATKPVLSMLDDEMNNPNCIVFKNPYGGKL